MASAARYEKRGHGTDDSAKQFAPQYDRRTMKGRIRAWLADFAALVAMFGAFYMIALIMYALN